jgi:Flp pilus assembly protein TadG
MVRNVASCLRSFREETAGNVAMMFGLCAVGVLGLTGVTVDYSRQQAGTVQLQTAADHIGLALALRSRNEPAADIQVEANRLLAAILADGNFSGASVTAVYTAGSPPAFKVNVTGSINSSFGKLFGVGTLLVAAAASVPVITSNIEIALVLDNTGSMSGDPPPLIWSTLKYVLWQRGGPNPCRESVINPKRLSRSCDRSMSLYLKVNPSPTRFGISA